MHSQGGIKWSLVLLDLTHNVESFDTKPHFVKSG